MANELYNTTKEGLVRCRRQALSAVLSTSVAACHQYQRNVQSKECSTESVIGAEEMSMTERLHGLLN